MDRHLVVGVIVVSEVHGDTLVESRTRSLTAHIVSAYSASNDVLASQLPSLIRTVHQALATAGRVPAEPIKVEPTVAVEKSVFGDHIVCLDCGTSVKMLKRHLARDHQMTPGEYRAKWGLPPTYPMVAPEYGATRSQLAKDSGLGRRLVAPPPQKPAKKGGVGRKVQAPSPAMKGGRPKAS
jgi:predicted transcriptional regulator